MVNKIDGMFHSADGQRIYQSALGAISDNGMHRLLKNGVLVGLSGGADSVMLLSFLVKYRRDTEHFPILAVHINHGIRGEEAERDEHFARELSKTLGIEFQSKSIDVPSMARECGSGLEEAARNARYEAFSRIISERDDLGCIAVAHNATDNLETVVLNMMRGAGINGMSGIKPVRDNVIRPLIYIPKADILSVLEQNNIPYVTDSTNLSSEYTRNYVRNEILPKLSRLSDSPEKMALRMCKNLISDADYIDKQAEAFIEKGSFDSEELDSLHNALFARVVAHMCARAGVPSVESVHLEKIKELLKKGNFSLSLPGEYSFLCEYGKCRVVKNSEDADFFKPLTLGENVLDGLDATVLITEEPTAKTYINVYKNSIQVCISFDIIENGAFVRSRTDGDSYRYGGATRKLKKLFNDKKIPPSKRVRIPVFCDKSGIFWVPGFGLRDDAKPKGRKLYITVFSN